MDVESYKYCERMVSKAYVANGREAKRSNTKELRMLLEHRKMPAEGWNSAMVNLALSELSAMDSNNFRHTAGVGEREGRVFSPLVEQRCFGMSHGIGRSGDIAAEQPKATGSTIVAKLANELGRDALAIAGLPNVKDCVVIPMATGMTLALCMQAMRSTRPTADKVIFTRVDQKSCIKSILFGGFKPVVVQNVLEVDELVTDVDEIKRILNETPAGEIACVLSVTSCFAPRAPDDIPAIAELCASYDIPHIVNNAYGTQSSKCMHLIHSATLSGRVDAVVQSLDKNFMVPVGGSLVATFGEKSAETMNLITSTYPGRASSAPGLDLFITLLSMGRDGYSILLNQRKELFVQLREKIAEFADDHGERLLMTKSNLISVAMTMSRIPTRSLTAVGSKLFVRGVTGARVCVPGAKQTFGSTQFDGFGTHHPKYFTPYLTVAAGIGITQSDIDRLLVKMNEVWKDYSAKNGV